MEVGCRQKIALVSTPGAFANTLEPGRNGMGDFDAILMGVYPGEMFGEAFVDVLLLRQKTETIQNKQSWDVKPSD